MKKLSDQPSESVPIDITRALYAFDQFHVKERTPKDRALNEAILVWLRTHNHSVTPVRAAVLRNNATEWLFASKQTIANWRGAKKRPQKDVLRPKSIIRAILHITGVDISKGQIYSITPPDTIVSKYSSEQTALKKELKVNLLNNFEIKLTNGDLLNLKSKKAKALISYLILNGGRDTRESLCDLFWNDMDYNRSNASLRQTIRSIKSVFENRNLNCFAAGRDSVSIDVNLATTDLEEIQKEIEEKGFTDKINNNISLDFTKEILYISNEFRGWIEIFIKNYTSKISRIIEEKMASPENAVDLIKMARTLLKIDPAHERATRVLMSINALSGNTAAALNQYTSLWNILGEEFDLEPAQETQSLVADIKMGNLDSAKRSLPIGAVSPLVTILISDFEQAKEDKDPPIFGEILHTLLISEFIERPNYSVMKWKKNDKIENIKFLNNSKYYLIRGAIDSIDGEVYLYINLMNVHSGEYLIANRLIFNETEYKKDLDKLVREVISAIDPPHEENLNVQLNQYSQ